MTFSDDDYPRKYPLATTKIIASYDPPPIASRDHDWSAVTDNYEPGQPIGWGPSRMDAIIDLIDQLDPDSVEFHHEI